MAEIWRRPTEKEKKTMMEQIDDNITYAIFRDLLKEAIKRKEENFEIPIRKDLNDWILKTKKLIRKGKYVVLYNLLEEIAEAISNEQNDEEAVERDIKEQKKVLGKDIKKIYAHNFENNKLLEEGVKITEIAEKYGLKVKRNKCPCPFHADKDPSLTFSDAKGVFHCFGCNESGNILMFIKKMEEINGNK